MKKIEPKIPENEPNNPFLKLKQILGFTPVWCINADSGFDLWANSLLTVCEYPEYFYMADCKNAYAVSKTEWESYLNNYMDTNASMPKIFYADSIPQNERYGFEFFVSKEELLSNLIYNTPLVELGQIMINNEGIYRDALLNKINSAQSKKKQLRMLHNLYIDTGNVIYQYNMYVLKNSNLPAPGVGLGFADQFANLYAEYSFFNTTEEYLKSLHNLLAACYQGDPNAIDFVMSSKSPFFS